MSTKDTQKNQPSKVPPTFEQWNENFFKVPLNGAMAKKLRFENEKYSKEKQEEKEKKTPVSDYATLRQWLFKVNTVMKAAPNKRAPGLTLIDKQVDVIIFKANNDKDLVGKEKTLQLAVLDQVKKKIAALQLSIEVDERKAKQQVALDQINQTAGRLKPKEFVDGIQKQFSPEKCDAIELSTKAEKSDFINVIAAMRSLNDVQKKLAGGKASYADFTRESLNLRTLAKDYVTSHKNPLTKEGKERVKQAELAIEGVDTIQRLVESMNGEISKVCEQVRALKTEESSLPLMETLRGFLKFPYLGSENKTKIDKAILDITTKQQTLVNGLLQKKGLNNPTNDQMAEVLLTLPGGCKPPEQKGNSDSFFINGPDGKPKFILKPVNGESQFSPDWPKGGGAPREALLSEMSQKMGATMGLDFGVPKTTTVRMEDDSFKQGTKSKDRVRVGSLQEAVKVGNPSDCKGLFLGKKVLSPQEMKNFLNSPNEDDVHNMAIMDFITLNGDRQPDNILLQDPVSDQPGQNRLTPIDAGQSLPTRTAYKRGCTSMTSNSPYDPNNPVVQDAQNMIMQLPAASKKMGQKQLDALDKLDPDAMVKQMKLDYEAMGKNQPEMAGKISDESLEMVRRSAHFLKQAAKELTVYEISQIYARGFDDILDADPKQLDKAIKDTIALKKKLNQLGGEDKLKKLGVAMYPPLDMKEMVKILEQTGDKGSGDAMVNYFNVLADRCKSLDPMFVDSDAQDKQTLKQLQSNKFTNGSQINHVINRDYGDFIAYASNGGDPMFKTVLAGNDGAYAKFAALPVGEKCMPISVNFSREFFRLGGYPRLKELAGTGYDAIKDLDYKAHLKKLEELVANAG